MWRVSSLWGTAPPITHAKNTRYSFSLLAAAVQVYDLDSACQKHLCPFTWKFVRQSSRDGDRIHLVWILCIYVIFPETKMAGTFGANNPGECDARSWGVWGQEMAAVVVSPEHPACYSGWFWLRAWWSSPRNSVISSTVFSSHFWNWMFVFVKKFHWDRIQTT